MTNKKIKSEKETGKAVIEQEKIDEAKQKYAKYDQLMDYVPYIIIIIFVVLIRTFIATPVRVNGSSMDPTLKDKDIMILYKLAPRINGYNRFDIVVIKTKTDGKLIKRVIGLPGENVRYEIKEEDNGEVKTTLYINGKEVEEKYVPEEKKLDTCKYDNNLCTEEGITLGKDEFFVMGDNRGDSKDSRIIGPIKKETLLGTTSFRLFPFNKMKNVK